MQKKKKILCYTCFKNYVQMLLTTMACFVQPRRWLWSPADLCLWGGGFSRCSAGIGELTECSKRDTVSPNHEGCFLQLDVILQDVCGNVHLHFSICSDIFLLASRYNKKDKKRRNPISKKTVLFEQWGPTLQSRAQGRNSGEKGWGWVIYSLSVQPARKQGLKTIQGMPGDLKWGRQAGASHSLRVQSPHSHRSQAWSLARDMPEAFKLLIKINTLPSLSFLEQATQWAPRSPSGGEASFPSEQMRAAGGPSPLPIVQLPDSLR